MQAQYNIVIGAATGEKVVYVHVNVVTTVDARPNTTWYGWRRGCRMWWHGYK